MIESGGRALARAAAVPEAQPWADAAPAKTLSELQKLDAFRVHHLPADALGRVEVDVGLVRVGIAKDRRRIALGDHIAGLEVAEGDRQAVGR